MDVRLVVEKGSSQTQTFRLRGSETIVGRMRGCQVRIPSRSVSRRHCKLLCKDDFLVVQDMASVNGTFVNDVLIAKPTVVHPNDRLRVGTVTFVVQYQLTPGAIEKILEEHEKEAEMLPVFDASSVLNKLKSLEKNGAPPVKKKSKVAKKKSQPALKKEHIEKPARPPKKRADWDIPSRSEIRDILSNSNDE